MKVVRVPWIRCRADEVDAVSSEVVWRGRTFSVLAYSQTEALGWWRGLDDRQREELLGLEEKNVNDDPRLF